MQMGPCTMLRAVMERLLSSLTDRGFAVVERLVPDEALARLAQSFRRHAEDGIARSAEILFTHLPPPPKLGDDAPRGMDRLMEQWLNPHRRPPPFSTRAVAEALRPAVTAWLGEPAILFQDLLMEKTSAHRTFHWHQDFPFWPVDAPIGLVVWAPLDPVDETSGGLRLAAGSHRGGVGPAIDLHTGAAQPGSRGEIPEAARFEVVTPRLEPGDAIVFHPLTWHMSLENRSGRRRRAWASTWLGASARWSHARAPRHPLCRILEDGAPVGSLEGTRA